MSTILCDKLDCTHFLSSRAECRLTGISLNSKGTCNQMKIEPPEPEKVTIYRPLLDSDKIPEVFFFSIDKMIEGMDGLFWEGNYIIQNLDVFRVNK